MVGQKFEKKKENSFKCSLPVIASSYLKKFLLGKTERTRIKQFGIEIENDWTELQIAKVPSNILESTNWLRSGICKKKFRRGKTKRDIEWQKRMKIMKNRGKCCSKKKESRHFFETLSSARNLIYS